MDLLIEAWVSALIERAKLSWMLGGGVKWKPGEPLKLLFAGYMGGGNMGSDVRVNEMLRQVGLEPVWHEIEDFGTERHLFVVAIKHKVN